jgi:putative transcriptional regulator
METKLAPGFLAASPHIKDSYFKNAVIFLLEYDDDDGAFGLMINRGISLSMLDIFDELDISVADEMKEQEFPGVLNGGPVMPEAGWVIHEAGWKSSGTKLFRNAGVTASRSVLEDIAKGRGPDVYRFCLGYCGWGAGQLSGEIRDGVWIHVPFNEELLLHTPVEERWKTAISTLGIDPAFLSPGSSNQGVAN